MSHNVSLFQNSISLKMNSPSSCCDTITHQKFARFCTNSIFGKLWVRPRPPTNQIGFDYKKYEEPFPTQNIWRPDT